jgi:hypothetical protein
LSHIQDRDPRQRHQYRGARVLWLQRSHQCHDRQQRGRHWGLGVLRLHQPDCDNSGCV